VKKLRSKATLGFCCIWLIAVAAGLRALWGYSFTPAASGAVATQWPRETTLVRGGQPTLVMFLHPQCPCSTASVDELAKIVARCRDQVAVKIVAVKPAGVDSSWESTPLLERARALPGVKVSIDSEGREAARFGAVASGHVELFDTAGKLLFSGGITSARGHEGDNAGSDAIVNLTQHHLAATAQTNVFGCSLGVDVSKCATGARACPR
jgi:hypothetical protein